LKARFSSDNQHDAACNDALVSMLFLVRITPEKACDALALCKFRINGTPTTETVGLE